MPPLLLIVHVCPGRPAWARPVAWAVTFAVALGWLLALGLAGALLALLSPLLCIAVAVMAVKQRSRRLLRAMWAAACILCSLRGLALDVRSGDSRVLLRLL